MDYKQVIVIRSDLKLSKGKAASQAAHASLEAFKKADKRIVNTWEAEGSKKVILKTDSLKELKDLFKKAKSSKLPVSMIRDAGKTHIKRGTTTCIAIGPEKEESIDRITKHLKLLG